MTIMIVWVLLEDAQLMLNFGAMVVQLYKCSRVQLSQLVWCIPVGPSLF